MKKSVELESMCMNRECWLNPKLLERDGKGIEFRAVQAHWGSEVQGHWGFGSSVSVVPGCGLY